MRSKTHELRNMKQQASASLRSRQHSTDAPAPRNPRYMRPSTSLSAVRRHLSTHGMPLGVCVGDIKTYHDRYCESFNTSTTDGQLLLAEANKRYQTLFWPRLPELIAETQRHHERRYARFCKGTPCNTTTLHKYMKLKPAPRNMAECNHTHLRAMQRLYDEVVKKKRSADKCEDTPYGKCSRCDVELVNFRFTDVCPECHNTTEAVSSKDRNFKEFEGQDVRPVATYKRINHFNEWLMRTQGLEQRRVPAVVIDAVKARLKMTTKPVTKDTPPQVAYSVVRNALAASRYQDYFEHVPQVMRAVVGVKPPQLTPEQLKEIRCVFFAIQKPFDRHKPAKRRNFLSYSYVIYKICELLEYDEMLPFCPLFKSVRNQRNADLIWKKICGELDYEYIATV